MRNFKFIATHKAFFKKYFYFCRSGYDHVLFFGYLVPYLFERGEKPQLDKRGNKVISIRLNRGTAFRDITKLLAPSTNLRSFGLLCGLEQEKAHFPFAFLDSVYKLSYPGLPDDPACWISDLGGGESVEKQMREAKKIFEASQCKTLGDYLKVYLKLDTEILYKAIQLWRKRLSELIKIDFIEHKKFTISSLSYLAGIRTNSNLLRVGTFFPNNKQAYAILRRGMRG